IDCTSNFRCVQVYSLVQQRKNQSCQSKNKSCLISSALDKKYSELLTYEQTSITSVNIQKSVDFLDLKELIKMQFVVNLLHKITNIISDSEDINSKEALSADEVYQALIVNDTLITSYIKTSAKQVQKVVMSDISKKHSSEKGLAFMNEDNLQPTQIEITIDSAKRANAVAMLSQQINRKDQLNFLKTILEFGKDETKAQLGLSERDFNKKFERALKTLTKYQASNIEDYEYAKVLINSIIMSNVSDLEQSENDEIADTYEQLTHQQSFYF
ncbi:hypothetical protein, partial [Leuconostoc falkenbergense]|uniref:hypothetical protein n=1 Tax=Leuconostoc falkenbergense TaxID=2766470 RepID=UPI001A7E6FC2